MTTEAQMVLEALQTRLLAEVLAVKTQLPRKHVQQAVAEIVEEMTS